MKHQHPRPTPTTGTLTYCLLAFVAMAGLAIAIVLIPRVRWQYAMLPVINGKRFGRLFWVTIGLAMSMVAVVLLNYAQHTVLYVAAMALLFFAWPAVQSFLLAVTADMDRTGRLSAIAGLTAYVGVASGPLFAARVRAIIWDDCGPCTQLVVNMALEAKVSPDRVRAMVDMDLDNLPESTALVARFTELVLAHNPEADEVREQIRALWGSNGLIAIAYSISSSRVYPALKYTLGYGHACSRVQINDQTLAPARSAEGTRIGALSRTSGGGHRPERT